MSKIKSSRKRKSDVVIKAEKQLKKMSDKETAMYLGIPFKKYIINKKENKNKVIEKIMQDMSKSDSLLATGGKLDSRLRQSVIQTIASTNTGLKREDLENKTDDELTEIYKGLPVYGYKKGGLIKNDKGEYLWIFNWVGGGGNEVWAKTIKDAIERANGTSSNLVVDVGTLKKATEEIKKTFDRSIDMMAWGKGGIPQKRRHIGPHYFASNIKDVEDHITTLGKTTIYYVKGDDVVTNISLTENEALEAQENHNKTFVSKYGRANIYKKEVDTSDWNDGKITTSNYKEWERKKMQEEGMSLQDKYELGVNQNLIYHGFDVLNLTPQQRNLIMQPSEGPENYMMDGEISAKQAFTMWKRKLEKSGLSASDIKKAINLNFKAHGGKMGDFIKSEEHQNQ